HNQAERNDQQDRAGGNPHHQATDLLILQSGYMPCGSRLNIRRIPGMSGVSEKDSQETGVNRGREDVDDRASVTKLAAMLLQESPPKQKRRAEKADMLRRVNGVASQ